MRTALHRVGAAPPPLGFVCPVLPFYAKQTSGPLKIHLLPVLSRARYSTDPPTSIKRKEVPRREGSWPRVGRRTVDEQQTKNEVSVKEEEEGRGVGPAGAYRLVERLAKRIARSGLCSRREAERLIQEGLVSVDGVVITSPAINVTPASVVKINNKKLDKTPPPQVWLHYKKRGVLVTHHDPQGREALFPHLRRMGLPHLVSVGRLDYTSEGLLLLTNNGRLARYLEHPSNEYERKYKVRIRGKVEQKVIDRLAKGITVGGVDYGPIKVTPIEKRNVEEHSTNEWVYVSLKEGKNREIRRVFEHFQLIITRLVRVQYGPYKLDKKLEPGDVAETKLRLDTVKKADKYWWLWYSTGLVLARMIVLL